MNLKRHLTYANIMSTLGAFFALAGGSAAIAAIPDDNSVDSQTVIDDSLKSRDLMNGEGVSTDDVINETLGSADIGTDAIGEDEIAASSVGREEIESDAVGSGEIENATVQGSHIYTDAVQSSEIATDAVGAGEIASSAVGASEIENGAVDASEIGDDAIYREAGLGGLVFDGDSGRNGDYGLGSDSVDCSDGDRDGELIAGTAKWTTGDESEDELKIHEIRLNMDTETVTVVGGNDTGGPANDVLVAEAICLEY